MKPLRVGIVDIVEKSPTRALYARVMNPNLASVMPQVIGAWCREEGHDVEFVCYTGFEDLIEELPTRCDLVFLGAFTEAAHTAYALSALFRSHGAITVLGGPHARCYPEDAVQYFDYVLGFTDRETVRDVLQDCSPHRPEGVHVMSDPAAGAARRPGTLAVHRADARQGAADQDGADARQPRVPLHVQVLHRFRGAVPAARVRRAARRPAVSPDEVPKPPRRLARPELRRAVRSLPGNDRGGRPAGQHRLHRGKQSFAPLGAASAPPGAQRVQGDPAGHRVLVRPRQQVEDGRQPGHGQGPPGFRARQPDPPAHPLHPDQLRARPRLRRRAGAFRAHEAVYRHDSRRVSRLLAAHRVRARGAAQPRVPARGPGAPVPLPFPEQQPGDERAAQELPLARLLRPRHRPDPARLLEAGGLEPLPGDVGRDPARDERRARGVDGGLRPDPLPPRDPPPVR